MERETEFIAELILGLLERGREEKYVLAVGGAEALRNVLASIVDTERFEGALLEVIDFACFLALRQRSARAARAILTVAEQAAIRLIAEGREPEGFRLALSSLRAETARWTGGEVRPRVVPVRGPVLNIRALTPHRPVRP